MRATDRLLAAALSAVGLLAGGACSKQPGSAVPVAPAVASAPGPAGTSAATGSRAAKKRAAPEPVDPVTIGNVRYETPLNGKARGLGQNGGHVVAIDARTGAELWLVTVYPVAYVPNMEADKQDIFIIDMAPSHDGKALIVSDEKGRRWRVDLATHAAGPDQP